MGFMDEVSSSGGAPLLKFNKEARCVKRGSDEPLNDQEFVVGIRAAKGGYLKFGEKDQAPERHMGSIFPRDEAPLRSTLGNLNKERGRPASSIGGETEDPWTACIEIPLRHRETGEELLFVAQSKTSLGAARDLG
jgi:hypothetical protein